MLLAGLLAVSAALHALIVARFGLKGNEPPALFGAVYAVLAVLARMGAGFVSWLAPLVAVVGSAGLLVNWAKIGHDKLIEKLVLGVNALVVIYGLYRLLAG